MTAAAGDGESDDPDRSVRPARRKKIRLLWAVVALLGGLVLLALGGLLYLASNADRIASEIVAGIPLEQENLLGDLALIDLRSRMRLRETGPAVEAVRAIGQRLTAGSRFKYRWYVGERSQINAFAVPGGVVVVLSGLIEAAASPDELAGVLAHEVAHAELRHALRAQVKALGLTGLLRLALGDTSASGLGALAGSFGERKFSREHEREADAEAVRRLLAAGIDPNGMLRIYEKLAAPATQPTLAAALMATHPATAERIAELRRAITRSGGSGVPAAAADADAAIDWRAVQESLRRPPN